MRELVLGQHAEAADAILVRTRSPRVRRAASEPPEVLVERVQDRQEVEQRERRLEDRDDLLDVVGGRAADHRRRLRGMRNRDEPVRLTRIYTRGGDKGETSLGDGSRVSKLDPRVAAIGDVDELNSLVGWTGGLDRIQNELFDLGADLSVPFAADDERLRITDEAVDRLEREIDAANATLPELKSFVLPGGSERAARLFLARAVCRRAERAVLAVPDDEPARGGLPQPPLRSALRPRACGERRSRHLRSTLASRFHPLTMLRSEGRCSARGHSSGARG